MIGVSGAASDVMTDSVEDVEWFLATTMVTFPLGMDVNASYAEYRNLDATSPYPVDIIIDVDGTIAYLAYENDSAAMQAVLNSLL